MPLADPRWEELNERLGQAPSYWQAYERFMAVRLLGKQPLEAAIDRHVAEIYLASFGLDHTQPGNAWSDFKVELTINAHDQFVQRVRRRWSDIVHIEEQVKARQILTDLVARNLEQLKAKLAVHDARAKEKAEETKAILSVDYSADGEMIRRHEHKFKNELFRGIDAHHKLRKRTEGRRDRGDENSEAVETCGQADGDVEDLRRTGEGAETCGRADGEVEDLAEPGRTGRRRGKIGGRALRARGRLLGSGRSLICGMLKRKSVLPQVAILSRLTIVTTKSWTWLVVRCRMGSVVSCWTGSVVSCQRSVA